MEFMPWTMQPVTTVEIVPHAREEMDAMTVKTKCKLGWKEPTYNNGNALGLWCIKKNCM